MSDSDTYERLASSLEDIHERFPEDAFSNHPRLRGLLADYLPDSQREIRVVMDALDEGVIELLTQTPPDQIAMQIDRLVTRMDNGRGIRPEVCRKVVQAIAFALGLHEIPAASFAARAGESEWVGVSEVAGEIPAQPAPSPGNPPAWFSDLLQSKRHFGFIAAALAIAALVYMNSGGNDLVGVWELQASQLRGWVTEYRSDGTFELTTPDGAATGRYTAEDGRFTISSDISPEFDDSGTYRLVDGDRLEMTGRRGASVWARRQ